jgi:dTDP-4-amino-4,6-dideoxygalactose transaminase
MSIPFLDMRSMNEEVRDDLDRLWANALDESAFIGGGSVDEFERAWASYCGTRRAVGVANGTDAIELTLAALGIGPGDEVIVPANTFVATVSAVARVGAQPVFVDVDPATLLLTGAAVLAAVTERTAAVIPVHLYGQPVDMTSIRAVADRAAIAVVEDAAQAHGARWDGTMVGGLGDAACFSFYPGKNLGALGDGGAVVTNDIALADKIRQLANHGRGADRHVHDVIGRNSRLDAMQAGFLHTKLGRLDAWNDARRTAASRYDELLAPHVELTDQRTEADSVYHLYVIRTESRDSLQTALGAQGIATGLHYPIPCHHLPPYLDPTRPVLPVAEDAARRVLSLPMSPHITSEQIERVAQAVKGHVQGQKAIA